MNATKLAYNKIRKTGVHARAIPLVGSALANEIRPQFDRTSLQNKVVADATSAMRAVRQKISIDLHDSTIQPYIGLKLGLEALRRKIPDGDAIATELDELVNMTAESIAELRQYVHGLKSQNGSEIKSPLSAPLVPSILEMAKKYQQRHGIEVMVNVDPAMEVSECLASEIYQLVCEGLSNVLRHTSAKQAAINIYSQGNQIIVEVLNPADNTQEFIHFKPRSMTERVTHLGGTVSVDFQTSDNKGNGITVVTAEIPLQLMDRRHASFA